MRLEDGTLSRTTPDPSSEISMPTESSIGNGGSITSYTAWRRRRARSCTRGSGRMPFARFGWSSLSSMPRTTAPPKVFANATISSAIAFLAYSPNEFPELHPSGVLPSLVGSCCLNSISMPSDTSSSRSCSMSAVVRLSSGARNILIECPSLKGRMGVCAEAADSHRERRRGESSMLHGDDPSRLKALTFGQRLSYHHAEMARKSFHSASTSKQEIAKSQVISMR